MEKDFMFKIVNGQIWYKKGNFHIKIKKITVIVKKCMKKGI